MLGGVMSQTHSQKAEEVAGALGVNPERGLNDEEVAQRLSIYGRNMLIQEHPIRFFDIFKEEVTEPMILLLIAVGVVYSVLGDPLDAATIIVVIAILVLAEVWNEYRAKRSISALRQLAPPTALVFRNSQQVEVHTAFLVPGDVLLLKVGQRVPADARLTRSVRLRNRRILTYWRIVSCGERRFSSVTQRDKSTGSNQHGFHGDSRHAGQSQSSRDADGLKLGARQNIRNHKSR